MVDGFGGRWGVVIFVVISGRSIFLRMRAVWTRGSLLGFVVSGCRFGVRGFCVHALALLLVGWFVFISGIVRKFLRVWVWTS